MLVRGMGVAGAHISHRHGMRFLVAALPLLLAARQQPAAMVAAAGPVWEQTCKGALEPQRSEIFGASSSHRARRIYAICCRSALQHAGGLEPTCTATRRTLRGHCPAA